MQNGGSNEIEIEANIDTKASIRLSGANLCNFGACLRVHLNARSIALSNSLAYDKAMINVLLFGLVAMGFFILTHWLLKKFRPNNKWWDSATLTILLLSAFGMVALMLRHNVPLPYPLGLPLPH